MIQKEVAKIQLVSGTDNSCYMFLCFSDVKVAFKEIE